MRNITLITRRISTPGPENCVIIRFRVQSIVQSRWIFGDCDVLECYIFFFHRECSNTNWIIPQTFRLRTDSGLFGKPLSKTFFFFCHIVVLFIKVNSNRMSCSTRFFEIDSWRCYYMYKQIFTVYRWLKKHRVILTCAQSKNEINALRRGKPEIRSKSANTRVILFLYHNPAIPWEGFNVLNWISCSFRSRVCFNDIFSLHSRIP